jgi:hypothetical protein
VLADALQHTTPAMARQIEAQLLPEATGLSLGRLRARALALLLELDAEAVDKRRTDAKRQADVRTYPSPLEGMATLAAELPADEAAEAYDLINQLAAMAKADGDDRPDRAAAGRGLLAAAAPPGRLRPAHRHRERHRDRRAERPGGHRHDAGCGGRAADHRRPPA